MKAHVAIVIVFRYHISCRGFEGAQLETANFPKLLFIQSDNRKKKKKRKIIPSPPPPPRIEPVSTWTRARILFIQVTKWKSIHSSKQGPAYQMEKREK